MTVKYTESYMSFFSFLVQTLAIIGGLFTCAGLVESLLYSGIQSVQNKMEMGKLG